MSGSVESAPESRPRAASSFEAEIGARIDSLTNWRHQLIPPVLLGLAMLFDSWDAVVLAQAMPALLREWDFGLVIAGSLISVGFAGQFLGAFAFGPFAERYGRLPMLTIILVLMSLLSILCALARDYQSLLVLRALQGLTIGGALPIAGTYISELAPASVRGRYFATFQIITMSGYTIAAMVGMYVIPAFGWRWMFALGAMPLLLVPIVALVLPESPRWLARRGRLEAANRALERLGSSAIPIGIEDRTVSRQISTPTAALVEKTSPLTLFEAGYRRSTFALLAMWLLSSIVVFGITNFGPTIYTSVYHVSHATALRYVAISGFCYLGSSLVAGMLLDALGRRRLAIACTCVAVAALATLAVVNPTNPPLPAILLQMGSVALSVMVSMILWPYSAENFPTRVRATALGFFSSINRLPPIFVPILIGGVLNITGSILPIFILFTMCAIIVLGVWILFGRETAGRSLEDLEPR
jgi:putative MFS transporter